MSVEYRPVTCYQQVQVPDQTLAGDITQRVEHSPWEPVVLVVVWMTIIGLLLFLYLRTRRVK